MAQAVVFWSLCAMGLNALPVALQPPSIVFQSKVGASLALKVDEI
jgi:hypothetical protein